MYVCVDIRLTGKLQRQLLFTKLCLDIAQSTSFCLSSHLSIQGSFLSFFFVFLHIMKYKRILLTIVYYQTLLH